MGLARMTRVWEVFAAVGVDAAAKQFINLFDAGSSSSGTCHTATSSLQPNGGPDQDSSGSAAAASRQNNPSADEVMTLLSERKRSEGFAAMPAREPWTAIGTVWDPQTLEIRCAWEQPEKAPLMSEEMVSMWHAWALDGADNQRGSHESCAEAGAEALEASACKDVRADAPECLGKDTFADEKLDDLDPHVPDAALAKGAEAGFLARLAKLFGS